MQYIPLDKFHHRSSSRGATFVEILITLTLIPIVTATIVTIIFTALNDARRVSLQGTYDSKVQAATNRLERDVRMATEFRTTTSSPFTDPYGPNYTTPGLPWAIHGNSSTDRVLIIEAPAMTVGKIKPGAPDALIPAYHKNNPSNCGSQKTGNNIFTHLAIYFVYNNTLYKRYLINPDGNVNSKACDTPMTTKQSCPREIEASWHVRCGAYDEIVATDVSEFTVEYYRNQTATPLNVYATPSLVSSADIVKVTLKLTARPDNTAPVSSTLSFKIAKAR